MIRPGIKRLFRLAFHRRDDAARDVREEIRLHLELRTAQLESAGWSPEAARAEAERRFGSLSGAERALRETATHREMVMRKREWAEAFMQDLRYVLRSLRRSPTFVISATLTLALGIGANVALFSVLDRLYLQGPSGVALPEQVRRLYAVYTDARHASYPRAVFSPPEWTSIAGAIPEGSAIAGYRTANQTLLGKDDTAPKGVVTWVIGDYFGTLGVHPIAGRNFSRDELRPGGFAAVAIVAHTLARERFGSDRDAIGKPLDLGTHRYTIVGVAPPAFRGTDLNASDAWVPMNTQVSWVSRDTSWLGEQHTMMIFTLIRATTAAALPAFRVGATSALRQATIESDTSAMTVTLGPIEDVPSVGGGLGREEAIATRLAAVAVAILLIACANVANLLLARAFHRRREIGVRLALGVSRARLVRQLITESVVLALCGGVGALVASMWTASALRNALLPGVQWGAPAIGWRAFAFAVVAALVAGFVAGVVPAFNASRPNLSRVLTGGARDGARHRSIARSALLVSQVAMSCVLLAGAGLFVRSLEHVEAIDIGFDEARLVFAAFNYSRESGHTDQEASLLLEDASSRIAKMPGVERVAFSDSPPMWDISFMDAVLANGDTLPRLDGDGPTVSLISPGYFSATGMRVLQGRDFSREDREGAEPVIVVNATFASTVWPGASARDQCLVVGKLGDPCRRVIGVVSNAHHNSVIEPPSMQFYIPLTQKGLGGKATTPGWMVIRTAAGRASAVMATTQHLFAQVSPRGMRPIVRQFSDQLAPQLRQWRLGAALFTAAGLLALLVAAVGIYGTIAYTVSQRTQEIGVRIALGAQGTNIVALVLRSSIAIAAVGVVIGTGIALWAGRFAKPLLYDTSPTNPFVLSGVAVVLLAVAMAASLVPAVRAKQVDPMEALRAE